MPKEMEGMVKATQGQLAAIKDKVAMFKPGAEVLPGINVHRYLGPHARPRLV